MLEEEDLIFINSISFISYFWSFKRFPGHQQKLPNTSAALCKLTTCWVRSPANEFMWATGICYHQPQWIQGKNDGSGRKHHPRLLLKTRVKFWTTGIMMSTGQDFTPKPYSPSPPSASQIKDVFLSMDFVISTGKLPQELGGPDLKSHLHTQEQNQFPLLATNATVLVLLRNRSSISIYVWILPNFNHLK